MNPSAPDPTTRFDATASAWQPPAVHPLTDEALHRRLQHVIDQKTKPLGALGRLEALAVQLGMIQRTDAPVLRDPQLVVFAADHGLAVHGVSAYPREVTGQMAANMLAGGAAVSVLARQHGMALTVVDAGMLKPLPPQPGLMSLAVDAGTRDLLAGPAMTSAQCDRALAAGADVVRQLPGNVLLLGEMGIGNTSAAALLLSRLAGLPLEVCVGRGTGLDEAGLARKRGLLQGVLSRHESAVAPRAALAAFGGFEIAMLAGAMLQAAHEQRVIVIDGFIVGAALLVAAGIAPTVTDYAVFSHLGAEAGHAAMLAHLQGQPLLALDLRLGEGSGAALAWPLLVSAERLLAQMASFASAGVSQRDGRGA